MASLLRKELLTGDKEPTVYHVQYTMYSICHAMAILEVLDGGLVWFSTVTYHLLLR